MPEGPHVPVNRRPLRRRLASLLAIASVLVCFASLLPLSGCGETAGNETAPSRPQTNSTSPADPAARVPGSTTPGKDTTSPVAPPPASVSERDAAVATAESAAKRNNPRLGELKVLAVKIDGQWARVDMQPVDGSADSASWLLKKTGGTWAVVDFGTSIVPGDHPDAPASVFQ